MTTIYDSDGAVLNTTVTVRESEFTPEDVAVLMESRRIESLPRGPHGMLLSEATDPLMNPLSPNARGRFVATAVTDYAQDAIDKAREARRNALKNPNDDWPVLWTVTPELYDD